MNVPDVNNDSKAPLEHSNLHPSIVNTARRSIIGDLVRPLLIPSLPVVRLLLHLQLADTLPDIL